ncbi:phosphoglycolate phosphatase [Marinivivus vitaminiproducens]|uniref:phosphoglycolate phosphatase n=1 Tax=Marinivivus vitaminiproducens TaxID=3035935 RepID=UPI00279AE26C|nr:phosphoglycolate phosphatase [Geminicoccaceae bacterium SCSIO 64248]
MDPWPRAVVFDLDGTLVDTAPDLHVVLNRLLHDYARPPIALDEVRSMVGDGARALLERGFAATGGWPRQLDPDYATQSFIDLYSEAPCARSVTYPGTESVLNRLAAGGTAMAVCTNKPQRPSVLILDGLGLSRFFPVVVGGDVLPVRKPDPGHLGAVLDRLGAHPSEAVMIGDSINDVRSARALGMACIVLRHGYTTVPHDELGADRLIDGFDELEAACRDLARSLASA